MELDWKSLRQKYPVFIYKSFDYKVLDNQLKVYFDYDIPGLQTFRHELVISDIDLPRYNSLDKKALKIIIFHIGLVLLLSYWKLTCSPNFKIEAGKITEAGIAWFNKLLENGMGQYFYENKIDSTIKDFIKLDVATYNSEVTPEKSHSQNVLIPFSGGKDSLVTLNILKAKSVEIGLMLVYPQTFAALNIAKEEKITTHIVESKIDHKLIDLNEKGFLNGHTPYSAHLMMVSVLIAFLYDYGYVVFSNEISSDEANTVYQGKKINHQYSKSYEYEKLFSNYNESHLSGIKVFSFLRPLYDIQISKLFSSQKRHFATFRSCNVGQKEGIWCGKCPKCLSTFILLSPFLDLGELNKIFGKNLLDDDGLRPLLDSLLDESHVKPFECVGTREELISALYLATKKFPRDLSLLKYFNNKYISKVSETHVEKLMKSWNKKNSLPDSFATILRTSYE